MNEDLRRVLGKRGDFDTPQQATFLNLWRALDLLEEIHDRFFQEFGLSPPQYNVLRILRGHHPIPVTMSQIKSMLVLTRSPDVTRLVDRLVKQGFASRVTPEDNRRIVNVHITSKGLKLLRTMDQPLLVCHNHQLGHLTEKELRLLNKLLDRIRGPHEARRVRSGD